MSQAASPEPMSQLRNRSKQVRWHQFFGTDFDLIFTPLGLDILLEKLALSEPPRVDVVIIRRTTPEWTAEQYAFLPDGIRQSRASHVLIEHKQTESINLSVFKQALIYDELYPQGQKVVQNEVQTFIFSARTPKTRALQEAGFSLSELAGVYHSDNPFAARLTLISLNELAPELHNAFVQCFATKRLIRESAFERLINLGWERMSDAFWDFLMGLQKEWKAKGGEMKVKKEVEYLTPAMVMEEGRKIRLAMFANLPREVRLAQLTLEERLAGLAPEERLAGLAPEERLAGLALEERLAGLAPEERLAGLKPEERLAGLKPAELARMMEQIEAYLEQQGK